MNLAEIRKKAQLARQEAQEKPSRPTDLPAETDTGGAVPSPPLLMPDLHLDEEWPEEDGEMVSEAVAEPTLTAEVIDDFSSIELVAEVEDEPAPAVVVAEPVNVPRAPVVPQAPPQYSQPEPMAEPVPHTPVAEPPASPAPAPVQHHATRGFDPLAILLAGRESARLDENEDLAVETDVAEVLDENVEEYLCFRVASERYAINIMAIKEIVKPREVTEVPRMPDFVTGIISLRGVIIPIIDMRLRLALPIGLPTGRERVVVIKNEEGVCGVLVDEVIQVVRLQLSTIEQPPAVLEGIDRDFVQGIGRFGERMLILLNLESILDLTLR